MANVQRLATEVETGTAGRQLDSHTGVSTSGMHGGCHGGPAEKPQASLVTDASFGFINGCVGIPIMISFASIVFKARQHACLERHANVGSTGPAKAPLLAAGSLPLS